MAEWFTTCPSSELVEALCDIEQGLSRKEIEFIDSCDERLEDGLELTDKQRKWAEDIMRRFE